MIFIPDNIIKTSKKTHTQDHMLITTQLNHKSDKFSTTLLGKSKITLFKNNNKSFT